MMSSTVDNILSPKLNKEQGNQWLNNKPTISIVQDINPHPNITFTNNAIVKKRKSPSVLDNLTAVKKDEATPKKLSNPYI